MKTKNCKGLVCLAVAFGSWTAHASNWQIVDASYIPLPVASPQYRYVCSVYETSVCADVGNFYKFNRQTQLKVTVVGEVTPRWGMRLSISTGAEAAKLVVDPKLTLGIVMLKPLSSTRTFSGELFGTVGGAVRHKPCLDDYDREYFCGDLSAWTDFQNKTTTPSEYGFKLMLKY